MTAGGLHDQGAFVSYRGIFQRGAGYYKPLPLPRFLSYCSSPLPTAAIAGVFAGAGVITTPAVYGRRGRVLNIWGVYPGNAKPRGLSDTRGSFVIYLPNSILTYITPPYYDNFDISLQLPSFPSGSISTLTAQRTVSSEQRLPCVHACLLSGNRLSGHGDIQSI